MESKTLPLLADMSMEDGGIVTHRDAGDQIAKFAEPETAAAVIVDSVRL